MSPSINDSGNVIVCSFTSVICPASSTDIKGTLNDSPAFGAWSTTSPYEPTVAPETGCLYTSFSSSFIFIFPFISDFSVLVASILACVLKECSKASLPLSPR